MSDKIKWTAETALEEGRKYSTRVEFLKANKKAYAAADRRGLLDQLYPRQRADWSDDNKVLAEGRKYTSRLQFIQGSVGAYEAAKRCGLLDQLYPKSLRDWSNDEDILAEGRKYSTCREFCVGSNGAYTAAAKRGLLELIDFPGKNAICDKDVIYIWKAIGEYFNGNPVYKIGVTSARLGTRRIEEVAKFGNFEFDIICCETVQCKASDMERKLLILGESPGYYGFNGASEFRALSDSALYAAISLICSA